MSDLFSTGIRPAVDDWLLKKSQEQRDYGEYWSASSAGYCMRKNIFERLGVPHVSTDDDARKQRTFTAGHLFHDWIQGITKEAGLSIASEVELQDEHLKIRGHFDDLVLVDGQLILYDYKTAHSKWFEYVKDQPMSHYNRFQLGTYMYMLRKLAKKISELIKRPDLYELILNLLEARILKISKDDLRMHEIQLLWSPDLEKDIVQYWSTLNGYWKAKKMPECTCALFEVNKKTGVGFMADEKWNPYFYEGEPCSLAWYERWKNDN